MKRFVLLPCSSDGRTSEFESEGRRFELFRGKRKDEGVLNGRNF